ncbi:lipase family protein [Paenibacillus sp. SC116]|uniref:lipase family protein n=1 Tax=Paenibacillus sp. SC116 TaxID=2968986 RepID=UPI00215A31A9|nr:lipase family protein [Paenibacillus sp. SC116]MCR8843624.1 lipase family protein [Paenibacillus sp. SC116]
MDASGTKTTINKNAIFLAAMSYQAYLLFLTNKLVLPKGFKLRSIIRVFANVENPKEEIFGFIAESKQKIIISFRGYAAYPADLLAGYDVLQVPYPYVKHAGNTMRGLTCMYQSTRDKIIGVLNELPASKKLYIAGHNYGGVVATLAALDIAVNTKFKTPNVYTYGSLRTGDPVFASRFNKVVKNSVRVVNVHDVNSTFPATFYPPPFTKNGLRYQHVQCKYPLYFQLNSTSRNDGIGCYFKYLSKRNPTYAKALCRTNPGFCPDTSMCVPLLKTC